MVKRIVFAFCVLLLAASCGSEIRRLKETEYLRTHPSKPVVYPEGMDRPAQEKSFVIPDLSKGTPAPEAPELLVLPPRLSGVDLSEDAGEDKEPEEQEDGDRPDEGFFEVKPK